jgi:UDP-N-acetylglucosamine 4,6-dehydratase
MVLFRDKTILLTGGTGSFGQAFTRRILRLQPKKIVILSRDEFKQAEMAREFPDDGESPMRYILGDVRDLSRLQMAFRNVDYVIHCAALKRADKGEHDTLEFVKTNVMGSANVIQAAIDCNVKRVVALSTDKASSPVNAYGASKLMLEKLFVNAGAFVGAAPHPVFTVCRYGNVVGSRGSVVPFFKECLEKGEPLPITDVSMTRFVITMAQAIQLVMLALCSDQGVVLVPKLPSVTIQTIAEAVSGGAPNTILVGRRLGEKRAEQMIGLDERYLDLGTHYELRPDGASGFSYQSDTNSEFLDVDAFRKLI